MTKTQIVRASELRAGISDRFWLTTGGESVLMLLDDLSLHSLTMRLFDIAGPLLAGGDNTPVHVPTPPGTRPGLPRARLVEFATMPLVAAVLKAAGADAEEMIRSSRERIAMALEARSLVRDFDGATPDEHTPLFYAHAYNELRQTVADLLKEFAGINIDN